MSRGSAGIDCPQEVRVVSYSRLGRGFARLPIMLGLLGAPLGGCTTIGGWLSPAAKSTDTAAAQPPTPRPAPVSNTARPKKPVHEVHDTKPTEKVAAIDPDSLIGLAPPDVEKLLGAPKEISKGYPSLEWTYAQPGCAFRIVFYPDLKTASFHALKYEGTDGTGNKIEASQTCIRNILTARSNGPG